MKQVGEQLLTRFKKIGDWFANVFSSQFIWWIAKSYIFPSISFFLLYIFLSIKNTPFDPWVDVITRQEVLLVAISACVTTLFDLTSDAFLWPTSRRGVLSFVMLIVLIVLCASVYGGITAQLTPLKDEDRARIIGLIGGISVIGAFFIKIVIAPQPTITKSAPGGEK